MTTAAVAESLVDEIWDRVFVPPPRLWVWEWADQHRVLTSLEAGRPGQWHTSVAPYTRTIMERMSPHDPCRVVVIEKGAQLGISECGLNFLGYTAHLAPRPTMIVLPSLEVADRYTKQRINPMVEASAVLRERIATRRTRDGNNSTRWKSFPGGMFVLVGANAPSGLRSAPIGNALIEELDSYDWDVGGEGDPVELIMTRTDAFPRAKIVIISTPGRAPSQVNEQRLSCDQGWKYHVPCPECREAQELVWAQMRYELPAGYRYEDGRGSLREIPGVRYQCVHCGFEIADSFRLRLIREGQWVNEWNRGGRKSHGFHLAQLYSPFKSWGVAAAQYEMGLHRPERMVTFTNLVLGLPYVDERQAPPWEPLYARREPYPIGVVPPGVLFLTAGVDVQGDRLEVEIVGWGREKRSWSVAYIVIPGDTSTQSPWDELSALLAREVPCAGGGSLSIWCMAVDSGAVTTMVYGWARKHQQPAVARGAVAVRKPRTVMVVKGRDVWTQMLLTAQRASSEEKARGLKVVGVGASMIKSELYAWLRQDVPAPGDAEPYGFCHFPEYSEAHFQALTAEAIVLKGGRERWEKAAHVRNEQLDCRVYARAAAAACGVDQMREPHWRQLEARLPAQFRALSPGVVVVAREKLTASPQPSQAPSMPVAQAPAQPQMARKRPRSVPSPWLNRFNR